MQSGVGGGCGDLELLEQDVGELDAGASAEAIEQRSTLPVSRRPDHEHPRGRPQHPRPRRRSRRPGAHRARNDSPRVVESDQQPGRRAPCSSQTGTRARPTCTGSLGKISPRRLGSPTLPPRSRTASPGGSSLPRAQTSISGSSSPSSPEPASPHPCGPCHVPAPPLNKLMLPVIGSTGCAPPRTSS